MSQVKNSKAHGDHLYLSKIFFFFLINSSTSAATWFWRPHHVNFFNVGKFRTYFFVKTWGEQLMKQNCRNFSQFFWRHKVSIRPSLEENWTSDVERKFVYQIGPLNRISFWWPGSPNKYLSAGDGLCTRTNLTVIWQHFASIALLTFVVTSSE